MTRIRNLILTTLVMGCVVAAPEVHASDSSLQLAGPTISLDEAVQTTLRTSFNIRQAMVKADERRGVWVENSGTFDPKVFVDASYSFAQEYLIRDEITNEIRRRVPLEFAGIATPTGPPGALDQAAQLIQQGLSGAQRVIVDDCNQFQTRFVIEIDQPEGTVTLCLEPSGELKGIAIQGLAVSSEELAQLIEILAVLEALGENFDKDVKATIDQLLLDTASILRQIAEALRIQRTMLGGLPAEVERERLDLELGYRWQFRNGIGLTLSLNLNGSDESFSGKPDRPELGGSLTPASYSSTAGANVFVPLARGRGKVAAAGTERAAEVAMQAEQQIALHTATEEALSTVRSYWTLAAERARLELLWQSAERQRRILETTEELINAEELAGSEKSRVEATYRDALARVASARQKMVNARLSLVRVMGQDVLSVDDAPLPAESLPDGNELEVSTSAWMNDALGNRYDFAAAADASLASAVLEATAVTNLRRQLDLAFTISYGGFTETYGKKIYDLGGYWDAFDDKSIGPNFALGVRWSIPFKNEQARGRLLRAQSAKRQSEIQQGNLTRLVRLQLSDLGGSLEQRRAELEGLHRARESVEKTVEASTELFQIGDLNLIDLLTSEDQLVQTQLSIVDSQEQLALLQADIWFERGLLLRDPGGSDDFDPSRLELAFRGAPQVAGRPLTGGP